MSFPIEVDSHTNPRSNDSHVTASTTTSTQHLAEEKGNELERGSTVKYVLLRCLDAVINGVVVAPLVVAYFRGTWNLLDTYLLPENFSLSAVTSLVIGIAITFLINLIQGVLGSLFAEQGVVFHIVYRLYIYIYGFAAINQFRGIFYVLDDLTGETILGAAICVGVSLLVSVPLCVVNNIAASPFITDVDILEEPFRVETRFGVKPAKTWKFVGDVVLTVVVVVSLTIVAWRGTWLLFALLIFPSDFTRSTWTTLGIGYAIYITLLVLEYPTSCLVRKIKNFYVGLGVEMIFNFVGGVGSVAVWRGLWNVYDIYIFPDDPLTSDWLTHGIGAAGLFVILAGRSALVTGSEVDGAADGSGVRLGRYLEQICPKLVEKLVSKAPGQGPAPIPGDVKFEETPM